MASILKYKVENLSVAYLLMLLGSKLHEAVEMRDAILEKFEKILALWKSQYLSLGGRIKVNH